MNQYLAEFIGTALLVLLGNGVCANVTLAKSKGQNSGWIVITIGWGLAVAVAAYSVGRISGAHLNPAVTISLAQMGGFSWDMVPGYIASQVAGGIVGSTLVWLAYLAHWEVTEDKAAKLGCFSTSPAIRKNVPAFITEVIATAVLVFSILAISKINAGGAAAGPADTAAVAGTFSTWWSPMLVGLVVVALGVSLGGPTGYAINPARDLGPRIAHQILPIAGKGSSDWGYAWVPIVAPIVGGLVATVLFKALFLA